jgi:hypothetical protein
MLPPAPGRGTFGCVGTSSGFLRGIALGESESPVGAGLCASSHVVRVMTAPCSSGQSACGWVAPPSRRRVTSPPPVQKGAHAQACASLDAPQCRDPAAPCRSERCARAPAHACFLCERPVTRRALAVGWARECTRTDVPGGTTRAARRLASGVRAAQGRDRRRRAARGRPTTGAARAARGLTRGTRVGWRHAASDGSRWRCHGRGLRRLRDGGRRMPPRGPSP